jgi:hypothetical protein
MDNVALVIIVSLALLFVPAIFPWLVIATAHILSAAWELVGGSIFASYSAAGFRFQMWQAKRDLRSQAAGAFRSSSFRPSAWATNAPDRQVGILSSLGLPIAITNLLALLSLLAIVLGIIIVSPQVALVVALVLLISFLLQS